MLLSLLACTPAAPGEALVLTGWAYEWASLSHRIGLLRVDLLQDSSLELGLIGGDFSTGETMSDTPAWRVQYDRVSAPRTTFHEGTASFELGPAWSGTGEVRFDAVPADTTLVPLIQGLEIDPGIAQSADYPPYEAAYGYTTRGFGFALGEPTWDGAQVVVPVTATVRWAPQDRDDMNAAIPYARTGVHVRVLLVSTDGQATAQILGGSTLYPEGYTETEQPPLELPVDLAGPGREGLVGWRSFDLQGNFYGPDAGAGDYVRSMGVELIEGARPANSYQGAALAHLSNRSLIQLTQWSTGFYGEVVRVGIPGAEVESFAFDGTHEAGETTVGPTAP